MRSQKRSGLRTWLTSEQFSVITRETCWGERCGPAQRPDQAVEAGRVVEVAVAADDRLDRSWVDAQTAHVLDHAGRAGARVEQDPARVAALDDRDQHREPVLGDQRVGRPAVPHQRGRPGRAEGKPDPLGRPLVRHEMSVTLSIRLSNSTESTGSSRIGTAGSKSRSAGTG